ncbi:MAG: hypothetical protein M3400_14110 [Actinomycetota bacterium]|nr:hypothetical protein [Actinomycetota bacterium]
MSVRLWMFDTELAKVKALVGSGDIDAVEHVLAAHEAEYGYEAEPEVVQALDQIVNNGKFDEANEPDHWAAYLLAHKCSRNLTSYDGETTRWAFSDFAEWLAVVADDPRLTELAEYLSDGRNLVTGERVGFAEHPACYLTLDEVRYMLAAFERLSETYTDELMRADLMPLLAELSTAGRDLFGYAN